MRRGWACGVVGADSGVGFGDPGGHLVQIVVADEDGAHVLAVVVGVDEFEHLVADFDSFPLRVVSERLQVPG